MYFGCVTYSVYIEVMKKCLLFLAVLLVAHTTALLAQTTVDVQDTLFTAPDTVCTNQPVKLSSKVFNARSYYWGFCSGYLFNAPTGTNLGDNFNFSIPAGMEIAEDDGNYYGFVVNAKTTELLRLNFGKSLSNVPSVTNFGNVDSGIPENPTCLYILRDTFSKKWHIYVAGGFDATTSELARVDFGAHLSNPKPNVANFGNTGNLLNHPKGIFVSQEASTGRWIGYLVNYGSSNLVKLDFSFNPSITPQATNYNNPDGALNFPSDMAATYDNGAWHLFVSNYGNSTLARIDLGATLNTTTPVGTNLGDFLFRILKPSALSLVSDCNYHHLYLTDSTTSQLVEVRMPRATGAYSGITYSVVGGMNFPAAISGFLRDHDTVSAFITNARDSTLTRISFNNCSNTSIPSFTDVDPPAYVYTAPGVYNVYFVVDEGLPTQRTDCKDITVLPPPTLYRNNDTTLCQGDTLRLYAVSTLADSIRWWAGHNMDTTNIFVDSVRIWPNYSTEYRYRLFYPFGCIVDTAIRVRVVKVDADAGPDRWINDGAITTIGGPYTSEGAYTYHWGPYQFMSDSTIANPYVYPPGDMTYVLTVTEQGNGYQCAAKDTMTVRVSCGDFNVPNAFCPTSINPGSNRFGLLNNSLSKLNYFRIYNRFGQVVFETTDPTKKWDGIFNGTLATEGVYVWEADGFCASGKRINKKGNVTLLR